LSGDWPESLKIMNTLYDLLGTRPSDDAETLRAAFRKAAKAHHPDLHAGDAHAAMRFRQIAQAYEILRDTERRAAYDRRLQFERERVAWRWKTTVSFLMHSIVSDALAAIGVAIVLAGGYTLYGHLSKTPAEELAGTGRRGSARIAVVQPARPTNTNNPDERRDGPEHSVGRDMIMPNNVAPAATHALASEPTPGGPVPGAARLNAEVANITNDFAVTMDPAGPKSAVERLHQTAGTEKFDRGNAQIVEVLSPPGEESDNGGKTFSSDFATSGDKRDMKRSDTHDIDASDAKKSDAKPPETKTPPKARIATKRLAAGHTTFDQGQAAGHTTFEQVSLENRNACTGSCPRDVPPLFGVGF
jgi:DnaJ domain